jgi:N-acetyl-alpha-D-muramate 1-phosphate uridylyltransferase
MPDSLAAVVLAAGAGSRLSPLTLERPKPLCPVGGAPMIDRGIDACRSVGADVAVNLHHGAAALRRHLGDRVHVSEEPSILGTGGAIGNLRPWIDGRPLLVVNADVVSDADLTTLLAGWDGERIRALVAGPPGTLFGAGVRLVAVLHPWRAVERLPLRRCSIHTEVWAPWDAAGRIQSVRHDGVWFDAGTPHGYLAANLWASGGATVVGEGAVVDGVADRCVLWEGTRVRRNEVLRDAVRTSGGRTLLVR